MPARGKTRKRRKQNGHNREIKRTVRRESVLCIIKHWDGIPAIRGRITKQPQNRGEIKGKGKKGSVSSLERHAPDLSPEISVTDRRFLRLLFRVNYRHSEAVSELASDYSGCSSLIVSATSPANREESFSSGTVALDHELTETFGEEGVYRRTRRVLQVAVIVSSGTGVH